MHGGAGTLVEETMAFGNGNCESAGGGGGWKLEWGCAAADLRGAEDGCVAPAAWPRGRDLVVGTQGVSAAAPGHCGASCQLRGCMWPATMLPPSTLLSPSRRLYCLQSGFWSTTAGRDEII